MQENKNTTDFNTEEGVTLKDVILKSQEYVKEVLQHWKLVVSLPVPFVLYMLYNVMSTNPTYTANLTFMVNEEEGGGFGGVGAILGQFGLGGGAKSGKYNLDKILELARSRKIIQQALFEKIDVDGTIDYLANHLIRVYKLNEEWEESNPKYANFFFTRADIELFDPIESSALKRLYNKIIGGEKSPGFLATKYGEETGIMKMSTSTESQILSIALVEIVYEKLSTFYIQKSIEKQQQTYDLVEAKVDSVKNMLNIKEYALAHFKDSHKGLWTATTKLKEIQLTRDIQVLSILYGETLKNLEIADFSLKNKTPFIQIIDSPIAPLDVLEGSKPMAIIKGIILGGFLAIGYILGRKILRDSMGDLSQN